MKGFTLIEMIITITIAAILSVIIISSYRTAQIKKEQQGVIQSIVADLEKQKSYTQAGKNGSNYGVKFNTSDYILFTGTTYATSSTNKTVTLDSKFQISETIINAQNIIYFSRLNGNANEMATITVSHITNKVSPLVLTVETSGTVSVIE